MELENFKLKELEGVKENLAKHLGFLKDFEKQLGRTRDPLEIDRLEDDIKRQKELIADYKDQYAKLEAELSNLSSNEIETSPSPQKILILTAIPHGLRLDKEMREIEEAIRRATKRDLFEIISKTAVRPQDIRRAIAEEKPQIVHFCGHGIEDSSLVLEDDAGNNKPVSPNALASLFKLHADSVKCVLLNACYSEKSAEAISQHIDYVIGMNNPIQDNSAIEFARGFYDGLGYEVANDRNIFERAFDEAMVAIEMENFAQAQIPVLKKKL